VDSSDKKIFEFVLKEMLEGEKVSLVSVVKTWGSSPRPVGSLLAVSTSGRFWGSVSGGCIEDLLIEELIQNPPESCVFRTFGEVEEERYKLKLPCGSTLLLLIEPQHDIDQVRTVLNSIESGVCVLKTVHTLDNQVTMSQFKNVSFSAHLTEDGPGQPISWTNVFGPQWRLLIIGAGEPSYYLSQMGDAMGFKVTIIDPRPEYFEQWTLESTDLLTVYPDDAIRDLSVDTRTAIVALAHDPKLDDLAIMEGLRSDAFYVGALGSQKTNEARRQRFRQYFEFSEKELARLSGPVGLSIGSKTPPEISLSVLSEIIAIRNGVESLDWRSNR